jgi:lysophospholipase L1-like esterase
MIRKMKAMMWALAVAASIGLGSGTAAAELPWQTDLHTRYAALGDSLAAGFGAVPVTQGYVYLLYERGVFDTVPNTILANIGMPGATSQSVLEHQVPQLCGNQLFQPDVITLNVGGNDLLSILGGADPYTVLQAFANNLTQILLSLRTCLPQDTRIYLANQYAIPEIPGSDQLIDPLNYIIENVAAPFGVPVADVHAAFFGRTGLLLVERHGADAFQVHPTNAGYRAIADVFIAAIRGY